MPWLRSKQIQFKAIDNKNFRLYEGPIPLEREKQIDLRTLSRFLAEYLSQEEIDELYPEPDEDEAASDSDIDSEAEWCIDTIHNKLLSILLFVYALICNLCTW